MTVHDVGLYAEAVGHSSTASTMLGSSLKTSALVPTPPSVSSPRKPPAIPAADHKQDARAADAATASSPPAPVEANVDHNANVAAGSIRSYTHDAPSVHRPPWLGGRISVDGFSLPNFK
jgi:hypothetical protein